MRYKQRWQKTDNFYWSETNILFFAKFLIVLLDSFFPVMNKGHTSLADRLFYVTKRKKTYEVTNQPIYITGY